MEIGNLKGHQAYAGEGVLTPSNQEIGRETSAGGEYGHEEGVEVQPLRQEPVEVRHNAILEEHQAHLAADLHVRDTARGHGPIG